MAAPRLDSDHPGLRILAEVASIFTAGFASEEALTQVVAALRRGLALRRCRLWLRDPSGATFTPLTTGGDEAGLPAFTAPVAEWIEQGPRTERGSAGVLLLRLPGSGEDTSGTPAPPQLVCPLFLLKKKKKKAR